MGFGCRNEKNNNPNNINICTYISYVHNMY